MLIHEERDELHLLRAVPDWWLGDGQEIRVRRAPTHFGTVDMTVRGTAEGVRVEFSMPRRRTPERIVLHLPETRPLSGTLDDVQVVTRSEQSKRWDFPTVVDLYRQQTPRLRPIPGLVELPLSDAVDTERCVTLDLTAAAVTDPFTAPFGVPNPGADLLFTGLPVGRTNVEGVPFEIIDPKQNEGRGIVVLQSPRAPKNVAFPKQVEIPVGRLGRRMFFLGNVHGWSSQDPGTGPWDAVAEYVIHYTDGQQQVVPLVTGRTIDEWAARPEAEDVRAVLRGTRWHLNLLGVTLRSVPVDKVVFRDLGTPSAPLLVAVTLEP
jgi:hypothetical protein